MPTFKEVFCQQHDCRPDEFIRRAFWAAAYPHVRLLSFLRLDRADHFSADRALIDYCGLLRSPRQIAAEAREFARLPENRAFLRRVLLCRVSGRRLKQLGDECFRGAASPVEPEPGGEASALQEPANS